MTSFPSSCLLFVVNLLCPSMQRAILEQTEPTQVLNDAESLGQLDESQNRVPFKDFIILTCGKHISFFIKFYLDICENKHLVYLNTFCN